jgi:Flp pilus assembly protein TadD
MAAAERVLLRAIQLAPAQINGYKMLASVYLSQKKLDAAQKEFDELARRNPKDVIARTMGALILHQQNKLAEAKRRYADIIDIDPKAAVALNNLAWIYAEEKTDLDRALHLAQRAAQLLPDSADAQDTLGWVYHQKELPALAIAPFRRSVELDPRNASYQYHLGLAYMKSGDRDKARTAFEDALELDPASPQAAEVQKALASLRS